MPAFAGMTMGFASALLTLPTFAVPLPAGTPAPSFTRPDLDGKPVTLPRGKLVLLDFWASWCAPCLVELPHLIALQKRYAGRLAIIGVSMDDQKQSAADIVKQYHVSYPVVMGDVALAKLYGGVLGLPEIFLIGPDAKVIQNWRGDIAPGAPDAAIAAAARAR